MKIYLCGKMSGLTMEEMNTWRVEACQYFSNFKKVKGINPVDYFNFEMDELSYTNEEVKNFDLHLVRNSDIVLVNLNNPDSIGTAIEMHEAFTNYKIPVVGFVSTCNFSDIHPWMLCSLNKLTHSLDEAIDYIMKYYYPTCK